MMTPINYTIITEKTLQNEPENVTDEWLDAKAEEQDSILKNLGFDICSKCYPCHFFNSSFFDEAWYNVTIYDAIQYLALKEGAELVRFENGNIGFVGIYGNDENAFEIRTDVEMDDDDNVIFH